MAFIIYGAGSPYALDLQESIWRLDEEIVAAVVNRPEHPAAAGLEKVVSVDEIDPGWLEHPVVFPLLTPGHRRALEDEVAKLGFVTLGTVVDPTAVVARTAEIGAGSYLNARALLAAGGRVGRLVSINRSASIGHHARIDDYATLGPGCVLAGSCTVGRGAFIGAGAVLAPGARVGENAIVGAGAVVVKEVSSRSVVVGNPARVLRSGIAGYGDVGV